MQNRLIETDLAYVGIGEHAGKERYFRPELFVFNLQCRATHPDEHVYINK